MMMEDEPEVLTLRCHGPAAGLPLIYLPGIQGDWTLVRSFQVALADRVRFVEMTYPRTCRWTLRDYATAVLEALNREGLPRGWLLGESFGSQVAWAMLKSPHAPGAPPAAAEPPTNPTQPAPAVGRFQAEGLILAGGFVRHPWMPAVRLARWLWDRISWRALQRFLVVYRWYAPFRHRHAPETLADMDEFIRRRTVPDQRAFGHRLRLILANDPRPVARATSLPVYDLAGAVDPLVPWPWVRHWLRRHCPGYRGGRTLWRADHNVLGTAPRPAAEQIWQWLSCPR